MDISQLLWAILKTVTILMVISFFSPNSYSELLVFQLVFIAFSAIAVLL